MRYKTLFRLGLKLLGLALIVFAIPQTVYWIGSEVMNAVARNASYTQAGLTSELLRIAANALNIAMYFGIGLYLFFGGKWIADLAIPSNRPYCPECGYDIKGVTGTRCPECDTVFRSVPAASPPPP